LAETLGVEFFNPGKLPKADRRHRVGLLHDAEASLKWFDMVNGEFAQRLPRIPAPKTLELAKS